MRIIICDNCGKPGNDINHGDLCDRCMQLNPEERVDIHTGQV